MKHGRQACNPRSSAEHILPFTWTAVLIALTASSMARRTYDQYWSEGIDLLRRHAEPALGVISAQSYPLWQRAYVGTLMAVRRLDAAAAGMVHPQRAPALRIALEAAVGRLVELRTALDAAGLAAAVAATTATAGAGRKGGGRAPPKGRPASGKAAAAAVAPPPSLPTLAEAAEQLGCTWEELEVAVPASLLKDGHQVILAVPS